jgi:hypothetical protein
MAKDIVTQLTEMQAELDELKKYKKSVQKFLQKSNDFLDEKEPQKSEVKLSDFELKICEFYELKNELDKSRWIDVMCNSTSKNFWMSKHTPNEE